MRNSAHSKNGGSHSDSASQSNDQVIIPQGKTAGLSEIGNGDVDANALENPEKRMLRHRKPVLLMQNQHDEIYATYYSRKRSQERGANGGIGKAAGAQVSIPADVEKRPAVELFSRSSSRLAAKGNKKRKQAASWLKQGPSAKRTRRSFEETTKSETGASAASSKLKSSRQVEEEVSDDENKGKRTKKGPSVFAGRETPEISLDLSSDHFHRRGSAIITRNNNDLKNKKEENQESLDINESYSSYGDNDELTEEFPRNLRQYPKVTIAEGSTTEGHIRVGPLHQASIPKLCVQKDYVSSRPEGAVKVWQGAAIAEAELNRFLDLAGSILIAFMKKNRFYSPASNTILRILVPRNAEGVAAERKADGMLKEFNTDALLSVLHDNSYNCTAALKVIEKTPERFLNLWNKRDRETYYLGFCKYFSNLRMTAKGFGESKTHKDIVDYHFRHQIPEQFRRYQESKLLQAQRMLQAVESRRAQESSNDNRDTAMSMNASSSRIDGSNCSNLTSTMTHAKKYRHW